jgi:ADP-ribose pyrophosphatase YjhB (NUDIX family)
MTTDEQFLQFIHYGHQRFIPHLTLDCTIFGYHEQQLKVLLVKWRGINGWALPGGYIEHEETLTEAGSRTLEERIGIKKLFLQQFYIFGDSPYRTQILTKEKLVELTGWSIPIPEDCWLIGRQLSIGYYALVNHLSLEVKPDFFTQEYQWCDINELPELLFDHTHIIDKALETIRLHLYSKPIGANLLPRKFTLPEIQFLYETLLGKSLDRRNFPKKLFTLGLLNKLNERRSIGAHRSPNLYEFNQENYEKALEEGLVLVM